MMNSKMLCMWIVMLLMVWSGNGNATDDDPSSDVPRSRQKRLVWITSEGRLAFPPGTKLSITPSLSLPFIRNPPEGFGASTSISFPFTINFDALGLTDNENPFGNFRSFIGQTSNMGSALSGYVSQLMGGQRSKRSLPTFPKPIHTYFKGGERALLYVAVEDLLGNVGMNGKACLLRAICEVHGHGEIQEFGFLGELMKLFLSASRSSYAEVLMDYVTAEIAGKEGKGCVPYFKECPKSLFTNNRNNSTNDFFPNAEVAAEPEKRNGTRE